MPEVKPPSCEVFGFPFSTNEEAETLPARLKGVDAVTAETPEIELAPLGSDSALSATGFSGKPAVFGCGGSTDNGGLPPDDVVAEFVAATPVDTGLFFPVPVLGGGLDGPESPESDEISGKLPAASKVGMTGF